MKTILNYQVKEKLYESKTSCVYRALREYDKLNVIIKVLYANKEIAPKYQLQHQNEYRIIRENTMDCIPACYDFRQEGELAILVLEDIEGGTVEEYINSTSYNLSDYLSLASNIIDAMEVLHHNNILHNQINPSNIIYNKKKNKIQFIDFGFAVPELISTDIHIDIEMISTKDLSYISPEQINKINSVIDYRSDYYALGCTFYTLFTQQHAFVADDTATMIHHILAKKPADPNSHNSILPVVITNIIMRMMDKDIANRYQSLEGIKLDFDRCKKQLDSANKIKHFDVAQYDALSHLSISSKLYGREQELKNLHALYNRVSGKSKIITFISGCAGIGKTALVNKFFNGVVLKNDYLAVGRYEQTQQDIPYSALVGAFQKLIRFILTKDKSEFDYWQKKLQQAIGLNGRVIIDLIPEVELVIGFQEELPELGLTETFNRFNSTFKKFIYAFCNNDKPMIIFLDDMQWADKATINLIDSIVNDKDINNLFFIGSYRDDEVVKPNVVNLLVEKIKASKQSFELIMLAPLTTDYTAQLLMDTLCNNYIEVVSLAVVLVQKTGGNPLFIKQFIYSLYVEKLLVYNFSLARWEWNLDLVRSQSASDNIIDLLTIKISNLPAQTIDLLSIAACIGGEFELNLISLLANHNADDVSSALAYAILDGLIVPVRNNIKSNKDTKMLDRHVITYQFAHDHVQQTIYQMLPSDQRKSIHWEIGETLAYQNSNTLNDEGLFDILNHLNIGFGVKESISKSHWLASLNLQAGIKAKISVAYENSYLYLLKSINLLAGDSWTSYYDLTLSIFEEMAEMACLCGDYDQMERATKDIVLNAITVVDAVKAYDIKIKAYIAQNEPKKAVLLALTILKKLGIEFSPVPTNRQIILALLKTKIILKFKKVDALIKLPEMTNAEKLSAMKVLTTVASAAYLLYPELLLLLVLKQVELSIKYGNSQESAYAYVAYGAVLTSIVGDIKLGYRFGKLSLDMLENNHIYEARVVLIFNTLIRPWKDHLCDSLEPLKDVYILGAETGDMEFSGFAITSYMFYGFIGSKHLDCLKNELLSYRDCIYQLEQKTFCHWYEISWLLVSSYMTIPSENKPMLINKAYENNEIVSLVNQEKDKLTLYILYLSKVCVSYLFDRYHDAKRYSDLTKKHLYAGGRIAFPMLNVFYFYTSLVNLALYDQADKYEKKVLMAQVVSFQKKMLKWAKHAPVNYLHKYYLVEAERCKVLNKELKAQILYDKAIKLASESGFENEEAMANELAGSFHHDHDYVLAKKYIHAAIHGYDKWGAKAKVDFLQKKYPKIISFNEQNDVLNDNYKIVENTNIYNSEKIRSAINVNAIVDALQAISSEIELNEVLGKLMALVMESAGAEKAYLLLIINNEPIVVAQISIGKPWPLFTLIKLNDFNEISKSIINYVIRTKENLLLDDVNNVQLFNQDEYLNLNKVKSMLCIPILRQSYLAGVLYLENNQAVGAFTPTHVEILQLLAFQAAISIENAQLYTSLMQSEEQYRSLYENAEQGIFQLSLKGYITNINPAVAKIIGYDSTNSVLKVVTGLNIKQMIRKFCVLPGNAKELFRRLGKDKQFTGYELQLYRKDGDTCWVSVSMRSIFNQDGGCKHYDGSIVDVTTNKEKEKAEATAEAKGRFLATMSHEIRTPINAIIGFSELAIKTNESEKWHNYLLKINKSSHNLLGIINDVLDFSKIEAGKININISPFNIGELLSDIEIIFLQQAMNKGIDLKITYNKAIPQVLLGDAIKIKQVIINLIGNAIKFTKQGVVVVKIDKLLKKYNENEVELLFSVRDTGIGIDQENIYLLFDAFAQADDSITRHYGGTGLGLSISKHLIDLMGGSIWVESQLGKGSTFYFSLTLMMGGEILKSTSQDGSDKEVYQYVYSRGISLASRHILVVDDNLMNQELVIEILSQFKSNIDIAHNGQEAFEMAKDIKYDLILMDIQMPVMSGYEATARIRDMYDKNDLPIMAMTANATKNDVEKCLFYGMNDVIKKPISSDFLLTKVFEALFGKANNSMPKDVLFQSNNKLNAIDIEFIKLRLNNSSKLIHSQCQYFYTDYADAPIKLQQAFAQFDYQYAYNYVHNFKGAAAGLGANDLHKCICNLEEIISGCINGGYTVIESQYIDILSAMSNQLQPVIDEVECLLQDHVQKMSK